MRSMTGHGRASADSAAGRLVVEVRTVNHKGLDVKVRLPRELAAAERAVTSAVRAALERGRVDVSCELERAHGARVTVDDDALAALVTEVRRVGAALQVLPGITEGDLLRAALSLQRDVAGASEHDAVVDATARALAELQADRAREGAALARVLEERVARIAALAAALRERADGAPARAAEKLRARLGELAVDLDAARLAQEAAVLADRLDVTEELERLTLHVAHARALLASPEPAGRKLDFLCQELLREANTSGSKLQDAAAAHVVVELKSEIERLREQVQNVE